MKVLKPQRVGLLTRVIEDVAQPRLVLVALVFFPFEAPRKILPEVSMWKFAATELGKDVGIDACLPKIRGEVLVHGHAFTTGGPSAATNVRLKIGTVDKELYVVGDRFWKRGVATDPIAFETMPVRWDLAFGGEAVPDNPLGKGVAPVETADGKLVPLPNIEDPKHLVRAPGDRPQPVCFDAYDQTWPQRAKKLGTYDKRWLETRFPGFAEDLDPRYFNEAPDDQQIAGAFVGDEVFEIEHMHPTEPRLSSRLPGVVARCLVTRKSAPDAPVELPMRLDTVRLFPHRRRGVVAFRAVMPVDEDDAGDILDVLVACEAMEAPRSREHYENARRRRLDPEKGALHALRDSDITPLVPEGATVPEDDWNDTAPLMEMEFPLLKNNRRGMEKALQDIRAEFAEKGVEPSIPLPDALPPEREMPTLETLPEYMEALDAEVAAAEAAAEAEEDKAEQVAREECEALGVDLDALVKQQKGGPPNFKADRELARIRSLVADTGGSPELEASLANGEYERQLREAETRLLEAYRRFTQHFPAAAHLGPGEAARVRDHVKQAIAREESMAGTDLTGADLRDLDLSRCDLKLALMEAVQLQGANLSGADLSGATLARADLAGANLTGATLTSTNLAKSKLEQAVFTNAKLVGANLSEAILDRATFTGADLTEVRVDGASFGGADLTGVKLARATFQSVDLSGVKLTNADLTECTFMELSLDGADLSGAVLAAASLFSVTARGASFRGVKASNLRCAIKTDLAGASFVDAALGGANFRGSNLRGADFTGARLEATDLSECNLVGANLYRAKGATARFSKSDLTSAVLTSANLMGAIFERASIYGADFRGANLFRADMARARGDATTNFKDANIKQTRIVAARPAKPRKETPDGPG